MNEEQSTSQPIFSDYLVTLTVRVSATNHFAAGMTAIDALNNAPLCNSVNILNSIPTEATPHRRRNDAPTLPSVTTQPPGPFNPTSGITDLMGDLQTTSAAIAFTAITTGTGNS